MPGRSGLLIPEEDVESGRAGGFSSGHEYGRPLHRLSEV